MKLHDYQSPKLLFLIPLILLLSSCAAGDAQFTPESPAGFWYGFWHGVISLISLIIHIFNNDVFVYEINNTGGWYDFGFLFGVICIWGGGSHMSCKSSADKRRHKEWKEWKEISEKVEKKVMRKLKEWSENEEGTDDGNDWEEIGEKVEKKMKRKIREWAEKD